MYSHKKALLLDMNSTFMFGEDRFGASEDFSNHYHQIGGTLSKKAINSTIRSVYSYLDERYPDVAYRHNFPSLTQAINDTAAFELDNAELAKIVDTFAFHEMGHIPDDYIVALHKLKQKYRLAVVIDIWSPKASWLSLFEQSGIAKLFYAASYSSDHGMVKPSPRPFEMVIQQLAIEAHQGLVVGDSVRRDLGGAKAAAIDCVLVGGAKHPDAVGCYENLLTFSNIA